MMKRGIVFIVTIVFIVLSGNVVSATNSTNEIKNHKVDYQISKEKNIRSLKVLLDQKGNMSMAQNNNVPSKMTQKRFALALLQSKDLDNDSFIPKKNIDHDLEDATLRTSPSFSRQNHSSVEKPQNTRTKIKSLSVSLDEDDNLSFNRGVYSSNQNRVDLALAKQEKTLKLAAASDVDTVDDESHDGNKGIISGTIVEEMEEEEDYIPVSSISTSEEMEEEVDDVQEIKVNQSDKRVSVSVDSDGNVEYDGDYSHLDQMEKKSPKTIQLPSDIEMEDKYDADEYYVAPVLFGRENVMNELEFGIEAFRYHYREDAFMRLKGEMYGLFASYTHKLNPDSNFVRTSKINQIKFDGRVAFGLLDYEADDSIESGYIYRGSTNEDEHHSVFEGRILFGHHIPLTAHSNLTPYLGFGYRYLLDDNGGDLVTSWRQVGDSYTSVLESTYDRESRYSYIPIGVEYHREMKKGWNLRLIVEFDYFMEGKQITHLEDLGPQYIDVDTGQLYSYNPLSNQQDDGWGLRTSIRFLKRGTRYDFFVEPFVRFWDIGDSETKQATLKDCGCGDTFAPLYGLEPKNETTEWGIRSGLNF